MRVPHQSKRLKVLMVTCTMLSSNMAHSLVTCRKLPLRCTTLSQVLELTQQRECARLLKSQTKRFLLMATFRLRNSFNTIWLRKSNSSTTESRCLKKNTPLKRVAATWNVQNASAKRKTHGCRRLVVDVPFLTLSLTG